MNPLLHVSECGVTLKENLKSLAPIFPLQHSSHLCFKAGRSLHRFSCSLFTQFSNPGLLFLAIWTRYRRRFKLKRKSEIIHPCLCECEPLAKCGLSAKQNCTSWPSHFTDLNFLFNYNWASNVKEYLLILEEFWNPVLHLSEEKSWIQCSCCSLYRYYTNLDNSFLILGSWRENPDSWIPVCQSWNSCEFLLIQLDALTWICTRLGVGGRV